MSSSPLDRLESDLQAIKSALPSDFPYDRRSVALSALAALCGVPLGLRALPGWDGAMTGVLLVLIAGYNERAFLPQIVQLVINPGLKAGVGGNRKRDLEGFSLVLLHPLGVTRDDVWIDGRIGQALTYELDP